MPVTQLDTTSIGLLFLSWTVLSHLYNIHEGMRANKLKGIGTHEFLLGSLGVLFLTSSQIRQGRIILGLCLLAIGITTPRILPKLEEFLMPNHK